MLGTNKDEGTVFVKPILDQFWDHPWAAQQEVLRHLGLDESDLAIIKRELPDWAKKGIFFFLSR